ncbi:unnamed protein product [Parascedosporium putredinis]|uniref:Uncharacterized protein n=1 Tax=Parascedosporium putredinis TaxID=1442378 RepID=A0A9P1GUN3_9PEZI|nr:unnamed protein product [Parascedosporium putredinis]CAI7987967.1 unnamed protein product [Parascedosporium putredinis]
MLRAFFNLQKLSHLRDLGIEVIELDVESTESIRAAAETVNSFTGGRLDFLINNSGSGYNATVLDTDVQQARKMFDVNVFGLLEVTQAFAPQIIAAKGQIINIGSLAGVIPVPYQGLYNASKAAIHSLSDTLRVEMAPFGVKVVTGGVRTNFSRNTPAYHFPEDSLYNTARDILEPVMAGRSTDMFHTTPEEFAKGRPAAESAFPGS